MSNQKIPPEAHADIVRMLRAGETYESIVDWLKKNHGVSVRQHTISEFRKAQRLPARRGTHADLIPWTVRKEHQHLYVPQMLRALGQKRAGKALSEGVAGKLERWLPRVQGDAVVHYDPDTDQGWFYVPRRPGIDKDVIRVPDEQK
ncbi:hypothetical protein [Plantactinospora sp. WMMB782]|uniref:hypothetical protein n=1 Tax=Plantactinospora sp. WMMB782 TaxID=3404121 RepID=UPI003B94AA2D